MKIGDRVKLSSNECNEQKWLQIYRNLIGVITGTAPGNDPRFVRVEFKVGKNKIFYEDLGVWRLESFG